MFNLTRVFLAADKLSPSQYYAMEKAKRAYKKVHCKCAVCGYGKDLEVHHIKPVHMEPRLAADPTNFITLCDTRNTGCHYIWGHFRDFVKGWNCHIVEFANYVRKFRY